MREYKQQIWELVGQGSARRQEVDWRFNLFTYNQWVKTEHGEQGAHLLSSALFIGTEEVYLLFVFQNLHFINFFKSLSSNVSFMQFIILTLSWRANFFKQAAAGWVLDNWFKKKKKKGSFIIEIYFSHGRVSDPFLWLCIAIYSWAGIRAAEDLRQAPELFCSRKREQNQWCWRDASYILTRI